MAEKVHSLRDAEARIYDGTASTPLYLRIHFLDGTLTYSARRPRSEEELVLNQNKADALMHWRIVSDRPIYEVQEIEVAALLHSDKTILDTLIGMSNPFDAGTWQPGGTDTFVVNTTLGATDNAEGTSITHPLPLDAHRAAYMTRFEVLLDGDADDVMQYAGVFWDPINYEVGDPATLTGTGVVHGAYTHGTAFTAGTEIS